MKTHSIIINGKPYTPRVGNEVADPASLINLRLAYGESLEPVPPPAKHEFGSNPEEVLATWPGDNQKGFDPEYVVVGRWLRHGHQIVETGPNSFPSRSFWAWIIQSRDKDLAVQGLKEVIRGQEKGLERLKRKIKRMRDTLQLLYLHHWTTSDVDAVEAKRLWEKVRDSHGIRPGLSRPQHTLWPQRTASGVWRWSTESVAWAIGCKAADAAGAPEARSKIVVAIGDDVNAALDAVASRRPWPTLRPPAAMSEPSEGSGSGRPEAYNAGRRAVLTAAREQGIEVAGE